MTFNQGVAGSSPAERTKRFDAKLRKSHRYAIGAALAWRDGCMDLIEMSNKLSIEDDRLKRDNRRLRRDLRQSATR